MYSETYFKYVKIETSSKIKQLKPIHYLQGKIKNLKGSPSYERKMIPDRNPPLNKGMKNRRNVKYLGK